MFFYTKDSSHLPIPSFLPHRALPHPANSRHQNLHPRVLTFSNSWYFIILCTGLINKSVSCSLWPRRCFKSCDFKGERKVSVVF